MLSKEEEQTILYLKDCITKHNLFDEDFALYNIEILINLITKLQKENKNEIRARELLAQLNETLKKEIKEKDKQIDLMAEVMFKNNTAQLLIEYGIENKEQIIKEFEKLVKEKGELKFNNQELLEK